MEIDFLAKRYGKLPSEIVKNDIIDFTFDLFVASIGIDNETKEHEKAMKKIKTQKPRKR